MTSVPARVHAIQGAANTTSGDPPAAGDVLWLCAELRNALEERDTARRWAMTLEEELARAKSPPTEAP